VFFFACARRLNFPETFIFLPPSVSARAKYASEDPVFDASVRLAQCKTLAFPSFFFPFPIGVPSTKQEGILHLLRHWDRLCHSTEARAPFSFVMCHRLTPFSPPGV